MFANIATVVVVGFVAYTLWLNVKAVKLQQEANQAILFDNVGSRIRQLEDQWVDCKEIEDKRMWYERLFNALEYFAFFANRKKIPLEMRTYYKSGIRTYVKRLTTKKDYSELYEEYKRRPKEEFSELRRYYKNEIGEDLPF